MLRHVFSVPVLCLLAAAVLFQPSPAGAQTETQTEKVLPLHACETDQGTKATWLAAKSKHCRIEVNHDRAWLSEGRGSLYFRVRTGGQSDKNQYFGLMIPVEKADALHRTIVLDVWTSTPETLQVLYVRLYGSGGRKAGSWVHRSSPFAQSKHLTLRLDMEMGRQGFAWEPKESSPEQAGEVTGLELVLGTRVPEAEMDLYVDRVCMSEARHVPFSSVTRAKPLYRETELVRDGQAQAAIVAGPSEAAGTLARRVQAAIREATGAELPVLAAQEATPARLAQSHAILLGNVCDNAAIRPLYAHLYTPVDDAYPPENGYLAHSVHDPWGTGRNVLVLGGSTIEGVGRAVDAFLKTIRPGRTLAIPRLVLADLGADENRRNETEQRRWTDATLAKEVAKAKGLFARGGHRTVAGHLGSLGTQYSRTGNDQLARLYRDLVLAWYESYEARPPIYGGPWGMDMDFHLMDILPAWDLIEESPALSDEDRLRVTQILFEFITTDVVRKASGALTSRVVRHNHMTFPALGLYFAGRYFRQSYGCIEADRWLEIAEACFTLQAKAAKPHEDCNGYGWLVPYHTMRYALATGDSTYFDNGNVRRQADFAILTMDNLGYQVPYGDTGSYQCWWTEIPFLQGAAYFYGDGRYAWAVAKKRAIQRGSDSYKYVRRVDPVEPDDLLGLRAIPLDRMYWESSKGPDQIPLEKAVDKVVMRTSFDPQRQYLLLDGLSNGGHRHFDGNSISRITDRGRIWLADNDYIRSLPKFHNSMLVFREGQAATIPDFCEREAAVDGREAGVSRTVVRAYNGVDWHRTIVWVKERFFLVLDDLVAQEAADYDFHCLWHGVGTARLTAEGLELTQQGPQFWIKHAPGLLVKLRDDEELGKNWKGYAFAEPVVRSMRQVQCAHLERGQSARFVNLLYGTDPSAAQEYRLSANESGVVVYGPTGAWQVTLPATGSENFGLDRIVKRLERFAPPAQADAGAGARPGPGSTSPGGQRLWTMANENEKGKEKADKITIATAGELDGRGVDSIVAGSRAGKVVCLGPDGQAKWSFAAKGVMTTATLGHLDKEQAPTVLVGSEDCHVYALEASGKQRWSFELPYYKEPGHVRVLLAADLDGDGRDETIAGGDNWRYYVLRPDGSELWHYESVHDSTAGAVVNLDGDNHRQLLCGTSYYWWHCAGPDGASRWRLSVKGPHATVALGVRFEKGNQQTAVFGAEDGNLYALDAKGTLRWTANVGDEVSGAMALDLDGAGHEQLVAASKSFNLFALDGAGAVRWRTNLADPILCVGAADLRGDGKTQILAGCQDGNLYVLDTQGHVLGRIETGGAVAQIVPARLLPGAGRQIVVRTAEGVLSAWKW